MTPYVILYDNIRIEYYDHIIDTINDFYRFCFEDNEGMLTDILYDIDCSIMYDCGPRCSTMYPIYKRHISKFMFFLNRIDNPILYNYYFNKLCKRHKENIEAEIERANTNQVAKKSTKKKRNVRQYKYNDLFDGKERVIDVDTVSGEVLPKKKRKSKAERLIEKNIQKSKEINAKMTFKFSI